MAVFDGISFVTEPERRATGIAEVDEAYTCEHQVGDLRRLDGRVYQVGMVSDMRMRLDPVEGVVHKLLAKEITTYGGPANVSPRSMLEVVTPESLSEEHQRRRARLAHEGARMAVASQPVEQEVAGVVGRVQPAGRPKAEQDRKAALVAKAEQKRADKAAAPKKEKALRECSCGCGEQVSGYFAQGHDARFKGWLLAIERGNMTVDKLPEKVQTAYKWVKRGAGMIPTTNYKGEPHAGYDGAAADAASAGTAAQPVMKGGSAGGGKTAAQPTKKSK